MTALMELIHDHYIRQKPTIIDVWCMQTSNHSKKEKKASVGFPFSNKSKGGRVSPLQGRESRDDSDMQLPNSEIEQKQTVLKL